MAFTATIFRKLTLSTFTWSSPVLNFTKNGRKMQRKTPKISFAPVSMTSTAMTYITAVQRNTYTSITPNFTQIGQEIWKASIELH